MTEQYIYLVTEERGSEPIEGERGWRKLREQVASLVEVKLPVTNLETKMNEFLQLVGRLFKHANQQVGSDTGMQLKEVEIQVEISAEGEVKLIAGGKTTGKGAITLKFERIAS